MKKLIGMTDFVLETAFGYGNEFMTAQQFCDKTIKYAEFLKTPLSLGQFVPCDFNGNVLEEPEGFSEYSDSVLSEWNDSRYNSFFDDEQDYIEWKHNFEMYRQSVARVFFEGFCFSVINNERKEYELISKQDKIAIDFNLGVFSYFVGDINLCTVEDLIGLNLTLTQSAITKLKLSAG